MKRYDKYKDSGVEWIGKIPENWKVRRLGNLLTDYSEKNNSEFPLLSITREKGVILRDLEEDENHNFIPDDLSGYKKLYLNYFGMNKMKAWQGSYGISKYTGIVSPAYYTFKISDLLYPDFFHLAIRSKTYISFFGSASDGVRIGQWDLSKTRMKNIPFIIPSFPEQQAIASFLDDKTSKIDQTISIKEKEIELLKERRQILIQKVITKGLDENVKFKDSGVEWIGEIPEHWEVRKLRFEFNLNKGLTITKENLTDEGIYCVNYGEIHSKYGFEVNPKIHPLRSVSDEYLDTNQNSLLKNGDFIFADTSEDLAGSGNFTYLNSNEMVFAGYHTVIARPKNSINSRFFAYEFDSQKFRNQIRTKMKGVKVFSITQSTLKDLIIWIPPFQEQLAITIFLDTKLEKISKAISLKQQEIEKLKEYKTVLIDNVVTGKVKVS
ncbi:restriction endonuclease subunit S [Elizabethkingia anophelis]|uniref:restriction endonuclease subunit S n=1 Tax=Elizabethkingia anophelis TaxID=1117645 RepID=UPI0008400E5D|nr:restriction endonuclease subunit S [Elizabethkingia anophelis]OCW72330.1 hypothetical protein A4G24_11420 [Elizabethkingia anophelis]